MREITQPMRLFDFAFGPLVLPLQDPTPAKVSYSHHRSVAINSAPPRRIQQSGVATAGWQPDRRDERTYHSRHAARSGG